MLQRIVLAAALAASTSIASAAGQVGQRYLKATLDGEFFDNSSGLDDGIGGSLIFNQPLAKSFDLSLGYSHLSADIDDDDLELGDIDGDVLFFSGTWFTPVANGKLFARGAVAWSDADTDLTAVDDSEWLWALETGLEIPVGQRATVTPYISFTDGFDNDIDGVWDFGVMADFDIATRTSLVLDASINDDSDVGLKGGVVFRF